MGPLMRTLTRLVERGRGCLRSTHGAHAPLMGPAFHSSGPRSIHRAARHDPRQNLADEHEANSDSAPGATHADRLRARG